MKDSKCRKRPAIFAQHATLTPCGHDTVLLKCSGSCYELFSLQFQIGFGQSEEISFSKYTSEINTDAEEL